MNEAMWREAVHFAKSAFVPWRDIDGSTFLVTGATGLIGSALVYTLLARAEMTDNPPSVIACVRNREKGTRVFGSLANSNRLSFLVQDAIDPINHSQPVDYIVHAASMTSSKSFVEKPVEVIRTTIDGTSRILEYAQSVSPNAKVVFLSTMEIYGDGDGSVISESNYWPINPLLVRNSYPESKLIAESLCCSYAAEYGVDVRIVRLAQSWGPNVPDDDNRVFAYFARCAREGNDIVLATPGLSRRMYVYSYDAATAILVSLAKGKAGNAYNVANDSTYCSIVEMAELVSREIAHGSINVRFSSSENVGRFAGYHQLNLDTTKIVDLGWHAERGLTEMYSMIVDGNHAEI